jgi:hypothetical protein
MVFKTHLHFNLLIFNKIVGVNQVSKAIGGFLVIYCIML